MRRDAFVLTLCAVLVALCSSVEAQQPKSLPRIGYLSVLSPSSDAARVEAFLRGLRALGYVDGQRMVIEARYAEGKLGRLPDLAGELARAKVDVIVVGGSTAIRAMKNATKVIPIVMAQDSYPVGSGFVASLARPGGNITGLSSLTAEISGKQLELLKENNCAWRNCTVCLSP
jgi:putative ABC transport system substrate-binding protein